MNVVVEGAIVTQMDAQTLDMGGRLYWVDGGVKGGVLYDVLPFSTPKQLKLFIVEKHDVAPVLVVADRHPQPMLIFVSSANYDIIVSLLCQCSL